MSQIINNCYTSLLKGLFLISLTIGGVNLLYAQFDSNDNIYKLVIENNRSKVISNIELYAPTAYEAKNLIELNGWSVIDIKLISNMTGQSDTTIYILDNSTDANLSNKITIRSPFGNINDNITTSAKKPIGDNISADTKDKLAETEDLTPLNKNLMLVSTLYYDLGKVFTNNILEGDPLPLLSPSKRYVLFGFSDDVKVVPNLEYKNNFQLSYKRAEEINNRLVRLGIPSKSLQYFGLGTRYPKVTSDDIISNSIGVPENRRVEIYEYR